MQNPREILLNCYSSVSNRVMNHPPPISCPIFCRCITFFTAASVSVKHWLITADIIAFRPHMLLRLTHGGRNYFIQIWHQKKVTLIVTTSVFRSCWEPNSSKGGHQMGPQESESFFLNWCSLVSAMVFGIGQLLHQKQDPGVLAWAEIKQKVPCLSEAKSTSGQNGGIKIPNFKDDSETEALMIDCTKHGKVWMYWSYLQIVC